jgi:hypothetical protein
MSTEPKRDHMRPRAALNNTRAPKSRLERLRRALHARKRNRERKRRLKQGHRAKREARAVRKIRRAIGGLVAFLSAPRKMFDCTTVSVIPSTATAAAGYVGGAWPTFESGELRRHLPKARLVGIAVASRHDAETLDVEPGDAAPADAPAWVRRQHARGIDRPAVYAAAGEMSTVLAALDAAGIHPDEYRVWTAHVGAGKHLCGPSTCGLISVKAHATQWTWTSGGVDLDESVCRPSFWVGRKPSKKGSR